MSKIRKASPEEVIEARFIDVSINGEVEALLELANGSLIRVNTILAGGYNVQRLHFRSLVKLLKGYKNV